MPSQQDACLRVFNTYLCIYGFNCMRKIRCSIMSYFMKNSKRKNAWLFIDKNLSISVLIPFLFDSPFMPLKFWKNITYEGGIVVLHHGTSVSIFFEKKIQSLGALIEIWPNVKRRKFKWHTSEYHAYTLMYQSISWRKLCFWSSINLLSHPMIIYAILAI